MSPLAWLEAILLSLGALLVLLAALGLARLPDLFMRMQAAAKASSLGVALMLAGVAVRFHDLAVLTLSAAIVAFLFVTTPVAAHLIARSAYEVGTPLWAATQTDELARDRVEPAPAPDEGRDEAGPGLGDS